MSNFIFCGFCGIAHDEIPLMFCQFTDQGVKTYRMRYVEKILWRNITKLDKNVSILHFSFFTFCECFCAFCVKCIAGLTNNKSVSLPVDYIIILQDRSESIFAYLHWTLTQLTRMLSSYMFYSNEPLSILVGYVEAEGLRYITFFSPISRMHSCYRVTIERYRTIS